MANRTIACPKLFELPPPPAGKTGWPWTEETPSLMVNRPDGVPWPRISIVSPSYNQWKYLEENIRSVLLQGYPDIEVIIHDGGSDNQVLDIFRKYEQWISYWISEPDRGQSHAVNKGILRATGEILFWLNSDDLVLPGAFKKVVEVFRANPETKLVIGQALIIDEVGKTIGKLRSHFTTWEDVAVSPRNAIRQVSTFFSRSLFEDLGGVDETLHIAMDTELLIRFTRKQTPLVIEETLAAFRVQPGAKTASQLFQGYAETDRVRPVILTDKVLLSKYKKQSARNWLGLSESGEYPARDRWMCIGKALKQSLQILFSRRFWSSIKRIIVTP